jgi:tetratricopeptide (TPR) repeat protein
VTSSGCSLVNRLRAKDSLNEGVREFNKGSYENAQKKFERALELSPDLGNAQLFHARALNARFEQSLTEDLGLKTIAAYDVIINNKESTPQAVDQALAFKGAAYDKLSSLQPEKAAEYKTKYRETLLKRAELPAASTQTKADVYYTLGVSFWKDSYELNFPYVSRRPPVPIPPDVTEKMKPDIRKAHEFLQKTISVKPDYANAWFYESLVYIEDAKTELDAAKRKQLLANVEEYRNKYIKMNAQQKAEQGAESTEAAPSK